jgi:hypothetical protein
MKFGLLHFNPRGCSFVTLRSLPPLGVILSSSQTRTGLLNCSFELVVTLSFMSMFSYKTLPNAYILRLTPTTMGAKLVLSNNARQKQDTSRKHSSHPPAEPLPCSSARCRYPTALVGGPKDGGRARPQPPPPSSSAQHVFPSLTR